MFEVRYRSIQVVGQPHVNNRYQSVITFPPSNKKSTRGSYNTVLLQNCLLLRLGTGVLFRELLACKKSSVLFQ